MRLSGLSLRNRRGRRRFVAASLTLGLVASACGASNSATSESAPSQGASAETESPEALRGEFVTLDGSTIDLASFQGQDVVLWFWAPW